jgi:2-(1,2-epoxy-1,2-dihydrophenyl)acetyl-CoA isomerase
MPYETLIFDVADNVAHITINRPDAANSLNVALAHDLMMAAIRCDEDGDIRAVILTGAGKMFCVGGDLKTFATFGVDTGVKLKEITTYLHAATSRFMRMDAPLVVAVNGVAAGAGMSLAVAGDITIAARTAKFTMAYTAAGLSPDGSSSWFLPRLIGLRRTQELMLTNRVLDAAEALEWGVVSQVVDDDALADAAMDLARRFASGPTLAYGAVKTLLVDSFTNTLETQLELEARLIAKTAQTDDGREGIAAFVAKRKPVFKGA